MSLTFSALDFPQRTGEAVTSRVSLCETTTGMTDGCLVPRRAGYHSAVIDAGMRRAHGLWISFAHRCSLAPIDLEVLVTGGGILCVCAWWRGCIILVF